MSYNSEPTPLNTISTGSTDVKAAEVCRVHTSGAYNEYVHLGDQTFHKNDLYVAFAGTMNPQLHKAPTRRLANPTPLGLAAFGLTTFVLSLCNCQARGVKDASISMSLSLFYGGFIQVCAGQWEMVCENTFGFTAFSSFGAFWISYGAILCPQFKIIESYGDNLDDLNSALGFFLVAWFIFTFLMTLLLVRSTYPLIILFSAVDIVFLLLAASHFTGNENCQIAGGVIGCIAAFLAWYCAFTGLANKSTFGFNLPPLLLPSAHRKPVDVKAL